MIDGEAGAGPSPATSRAEAAAPAKGGVFIGLGANLGDRSENIRAALEAIGRLPATHVLRVSTLRETQAVGGPAGQPDYLNGVAEIETRLTPWELLEGLLAIERDLGRVRRTPNGPRPIDLDILLFREQRVNEPQLVIPHPRMRERAFVMGPLAELQDLKDGLDRAGARGRGPGAGGGAMLIDVAAGAWSWIDIYRLCIGFICPRPIGLISTRAAPPDERTNLAPYSFYNMVSANPPVVMFCAGRRRDGGEKDSLINARATGEFVVATVTSDIGERMSRAGADLPYGESEFEFAPFTPMAASKVRAPLVMEAAINIECTLRQIVSTGEKPGSSSVVFGDIVAIHVDERMLDASGKQIDPRRLEAVGRLGGAWYTTVTQPYELHIPAT